MTTTTLTRFNEAYQAVMVAKTIDEVKEIRDKMESLRAYLKQQGESLEMQNACAEIKIRAERRAGELLKENGFGHQGGDRKSNNTMLLDNYGVTPMQSSRFQSIAAIPEMEFEQTIAKTKAAQNELTSAGMQKLAKDLKSKESYQQEKEEPVPDSGNHICADVRHVTLSQLGGVPFKAIILDPPWEFEVWEPETGNGRGPVYPVLTTQDIFNVPIPSMADKDSVLFLWAVNPAIDVAIDLVRAWGFTFKTKFPWIKTTLKNQKLNYGTGYWVRGVSEDVIIATRGSISAPRIENYLGLIGPNVEHSRKPQDVHKMAEATVAGPYLELFARYSRAGWVTVGNEYRGEQSPDPIPSAEPPWLIRA